jgi:hypothetical protein
VATPHKTRNHLQLHRATTRSFCQGP